MTIDAASTVSREIRKNSCQCGKGSKSDMQRIRRHFLMKTLFFWLPLKRYRCHRCMSNRWMVGK